MTEISDWDMLRQVRLGGRKPTLPVIVTTKRHLPSRLDGVGAMVIVCKPGDVFPVKLLEGLEVIFMLDRCELAGHVWRLAQSKGVKFTAKTWCPCIDALTLLPMSCESVSDAKRWSESPRAA